MGSMKQIATSIEDGKFIDYGKMTDQQLVQTVAHNSRLLATHGEALGRYATTLQLQQKDAKQVNRPGFSGGCFV